MKNQAIKNQQYEQTSKSALTLVAANLEVVPQKTIFEKIRDYFKSPSITLEDWEKLEGHKYPTNSSDQNFFHRGNL